MNALQLAEALRADTNAQQLAEALRAQATPPPHRITLDASLGIENLEELVKDDLRRNDGTLILGVSGPDAIPPNPPSTFNFKVTVPDGDDGFLGLGGTTGTLCFVVSDTTIDLQLTVDMDDSWIFSTSFPEIYSLPYDSLELGKRSLVLSTGAAGTAAKGLDFDGELELTGVFVTVASLLNLSTSYALTGAISGSGDELAIDLEAQFHLDPAPTIGGVITLEGAGVGVALTPIKRDQSVDRLVQLYLLGIVKLQPVGGKQPLDLDVRAAMPVTDADSPELTITVMAHEGFKASIGLLGDWLLGETWDSFFAGPAKSIGDKLDTFGLRSYTIGVPVKGGKPTSMALDVGTLSSWSMWDGGPSVDIDVLWTVLWLGNGSTSRVALTADFTYPPPPATDGITFELSIDSDLNIAGQEKGKLPPLKLSALNDLVFGGNVVIPDDLLTIEVEGFSFSADVNSKLFTIGATASASVGLFGTDVIGVRDMAMSVSFDASQDQTTYTGTLDGQFYLGPITFQTDAIISSKKGVDTVFTLHLVNETVGSMLNHFVHIVDPTYDVDFGSPWDKFLDISLDAFVLTVNVTQKSVELSWKPKSPLDLGFLTIESVDLTYASAKDGGASSTKIDVAGTFLGIHFPSGDNALTWDPINESPPAVAGKGNSQFDLVYAGLGQHIGLAGSPTTMDAVMDKLIASASPIQPGALPPFGTDLVFKGDSNWLIGAQFTVVDTVLIKAIFNDPDLYGVVIGLSGEKAKIFAGLRFEILYRKVTDSIGVYHIELKLPDAMRHLEFGEVSVTLPVVDLDIYTNGNFRIDFGFPKGLDFSASFSVQVFPFVGYGGFYFALLDGQTSSRVPQITNGTFSPVIEFGVALSIGVGKEIDEGILKGGISVTVVGILEGVVAWFHPTDSAPAENYYWIKGTIAVTGHLYASIDFAIIQASIDVTAYISVTLVVEAHEPIYIEATASVSVRVSVKIIFFTIHLSFNATVDASFTIGSATPTPWIVKPGSQSSNGAQRLMRGQETIHAPAALVHPGRFKAVRRALVAAREAPPITSWPAVCVVPGGHQTVEIGAVAGFTRAQTWSVASAARASGTTTVTTFVAHDLEPGDPVTLAGLSDQSFDGTFTVASAPSTTVFTVAQSGGDLTGGTAGTATSAATDTTGQAVLLLTAESSIPPTARTLAEHRTLAGGDPASLPFNRLMQAMLGWGIYVEIARGVDAQISRAITSATRAGGTVTVETAEAHGFLAQTTVTVAGAGDPSFDGSFTIASAPTATSFTVTQAGGDTSTTGGEATGAAVSADQLEDLRQQLTDADTVAAAFDYSTLTSFLAANFTFDVTHPDTSKEASGALFPVFPALKLTDTAGTSLDFSSRTPVDDSYVEKIRAYFQLLQIQFQQQQSGNLPGGGPDAVENTTESMATVLFAQYFSMLMSAGVKAAIDLLAAFPYTTPSGDGAQAMSIAQVGEQVGDQAGLVADPLRIVTPNQDAAVLQSGALIALEEIVHPVRSGETLSGIAAAFAAAGARGANGPYSVADLLGANQTAAVFDTGVSLPLAGLPYTTIAEDTVNVIATRLLVRVGGASLLGRLSGLQPAVAALVAANPGIDPNVEIDAGRTITLAAGGSYTTVAGDTLTLIAAYALAPAQDLILLATYAAALQAGNSGLPTDPNALIGAGKTVLYAALARPLAVGDTIASLAQTLMTTTSAVGDALVALTVPVLSPGAVLHAPLTYAVAAGDTFSGIAAKLDVTLAYLGGQAAETAGLFATGKSLTISNVPAIAPATLMNGLLANAEWNNAAGLASRFMLSGLRLPDPADPKFQALTPEDLLKPGSLAGIRTKPAFALSGQQYALGSSIPLGYQVTLTNVAGASWLTLGGSSTNPLVYGLSNDEQTLFAQIATTPLPNDLETLTRLALFRMAPPRIVLQTHLAWQAALPPAGCFPAGSAAGNPSIWMFPDTLVTEIAQTAGANDHAPLAYELTTAKHTQAGALPTASEAGCYAWATLVNFTVSLPAVDGPSNSVTNAYVVNGADDTGAALLQQVYNQIKAGDSATLYLLYPPDPAAGNASGMASDPVDPARTYLLKTNLSTLTHGQQDAVEGFVGAPLATETFAASITDAADFVALLWEASITRSGGFYLDYANANGGGPLPGSAFDGTASAQLALVVVLESQSGLWPIESLAAPGASRTSGTTIINTTCVHGLQTGGQVTVAGVADGSFNGTFTVASVPNAWTFSYAQSGQPDSKSGGGTANAGTTVATPSTMLPFNNCAVVGDNIDPSVTSVFVQPATWPVQPGDQLQTVANGYNVRWGTRLQPGDVAALNASVPQVLAAGQDVQLPGGGSVPIGYGDTFASIAAAHGTSPSALGAANATGPILAQGAQLQFAAGVLRPATTVPPGVAGLEITRINPDPGDGNGNLAPPQEVARLFNLVGWALDGRGAFTASGAGLPTTPSSQLVLSPDGLTPLDPDDTSDASWYYQQTLAVAPFGEAVTGSASKALPPAAADPYNGVGKTTGALNEAQVALTLQDVYGNVQPLPTPTVSIPIGYYDDLAGPVSWPSLAISYLVSGPPAAIALDMTMQQSRYVPSTSVTVPAALAAIAADLQTYTGVYYQLVQPDVAFSLQTTLALQSDGTTPVTYPLPKTPFLSFAYGAYIYLQAFSTATAVELTAGAGGITVASLVTGYGVTAEQLFSANQNALYSSLFGSQQIAVPKMYATIEGDTLGGVASAQKLQVDALAEMNDDVPLNPGAVLATGTRTVDAKPPAGKPAASLADVAVEATAHTSVTDVAVANQTMPGLLVKDTLLTLGTAAYPLGDNDTFGNAATQLKGTVEQVALANANVPVFVPDVSLSVEHVEAATGDTLASLAGIANVGTVDSLATNNVGVQNIFAPATSLVVGTNSSPKPPLPSDTLASYALANGVTVDALAGANAASGAFASGAKVAIPLVLENSSTATYCTYSAPAATKLQAIGDLFGTTPAAIVALNSDLPGLLAPSQPVTDSTSGKSVTTEEGDSFQSLVERFAAQGVTVSLDQLASDVAGQANLVAQGGLWICPPMRGDAYGQNTAGSLNALAGAYNADANALAAANAATLGVLSAKGKVALGGQSYTPQQNDTLNSLVNRFAALGVTATLADVIAAALDAPGLVAANAAVLPVPPPSPADQVTITPHFAKPVFQVAVNLTETRDPTLVDPDFTGNPTVASSTLAPAPEPDPSSSATTLALTDFAKHLESAIPGLHVATGDPAAEDDPASATAIWAVNFGATGDGPVLDYHFDAPSTAYYALPPLSSALMNGDVQVKPYITGQDPPFTGTTRTESFRGVDLDGWLNTFLGAVDLFLSPAYAVPAYGLAPDYTSAIIEAKENLAKRISSRLDVVLEGDTGSEVDAVEALYQSLLTQLSTAFTVNTLVQVPVTVSAGEGDKGSAPRLSGKVVEPSQGGGQLPQAYSFSTAKVPLAQGQSGQPFKSNATFLFSVKAPADNREVDLDLEYVVTEMERPQPGETISDYQGSYWLTFVNPVATTESAMPGLKIPVPLRAYPGPVTLAAQNAAQSCAQPAAATDLLPWDLGFVYQHDDTEQDTPLVEVAFNTTPNDAAASMATNVVVENVFEALAWFTSVWPALKADLAVLTTLPVGTPNPVGQAAVHAFCELVTAVSDAFDPPPTHNLGQPYTPPPLTLYYQLQKEQTHGNPQETLTTLVISSVNPADGTSPADPLWPTTVIASYGGKDYPLTPGTVTHTTAEFAYPPNTIPADAAVAQRFIFDWPNAAPSCASRQPPAPPTVPATLPGPQTFQFLCVNVLSEQSARAGVSIWRNLELVSGRATNRAFVYRTPITSFTSSAIPSIATSADQPISIGNSSTPLAEALGGFLEALVTSQNSWSAGDTLSMRVAGGYSYAVAASGARAIGPVVPIFLVASVDFDPLADWDWTKAQSFVSQVDAVVSHWLSTNQPASRDRAAIVFDMTIYASASRSQPLIHATSLSYALATANLPLPLNA